MRVLFPVIAAFAFSALLTKVLLSSIEGTKWLLRKPEKDRWHKRTTPSMGGIAMFCAFTLAMLLFRPWSGEAWKVWLGGFFMFLFGLYDDVRPLPPYSKLIGQIIIGCLVISLGVRAAITGHPLVYIPLTILWIVFITNAFNLLDNMDGLAAGVGAISAVFLAIFSWYHPGLLPLEIPLMFAAVLLGFLIFNVNPAKIFMGDCGSMWIGFTLAGFTIVDTWHHTANLAFMLAMPILILAVPIFDTALVALNRKIYGRPVSQGGRDHISHRLVALGLSERRTVWTMWGLSALLGLIGVFAQYYQMYTWVLAVCGALVFTLVLGIWLADVKVYGQATAHGNEGSRAPSFDIPYKRRLVEIIVDAVSIGASYALAYLLRYDWALNTYLLAQVEQTLPLVIGAKLLVFLTLGLYRGLWTYIDFSGFAKLVRISLVASLASVLVIVGFYRFEGFSRTLFAIDFGVLLALMGGSRALLRAMRESLFAFPEGGLRILVVGAGDGGHFLIQEIRKNRQWNLKPVAVIDDDGRKHGKELLGVPIRGNHERIANIVMEEKIDRIIIAIPSLTHDQRAHIERQCRDAKVPFGSMRSLQETVLAHME